MKHALRQLVKNPGFTVVALATLMLGIGVNTTAFTALNRLFLQFVPFRDPSRLVQIFSTTPRNALGTQTPGDYFDLRDQNQSFTGAAAFVVGSHASLAEPGEPAIHVTAIRVTANFFPVIGVEASLGRTFTLDEERRYDSVAVISHQFWREHYASDAAILGKTVRLDSRMYTIVGVMPPALDDPTLFNGDPGFWILDPTALNHELRSNGWYHILARLKPDVTLVQAQAEMTALGARLAHDHPETNAGRTFTVVPRSTNFMDETDQRLAAMVMALCGVVLLIACVNLANLQFIRATRRTQEFGVRLALGCSRRQLIVMLLQESILIALAGGFLGILFAQWSSVRIGEFFAVAMPLDRTVLAFNLVVSIATGVIFGLLPAWVASKAEVGAALKAGGRGLTADRSRHRLRQGLVVFEIALALALLTAAGFFVTGIYRISHRSLGWSPERALVGWFELDHDHYGEQGDPRLLEFGDRLESTFNALPGVETAETDHDSPIWNFSAQPFRVQGQPAPEPGHEALIGDGTVGTSFLKIYGLRLISGRFFDQHDRQSAPNVAVITESAARKFWPTESPIGRRLSLGRGANPSWIEIVGVIGDFTGGAEFFDLTGESRCKMLRPWAQNTGRFINFSLHTSGSPEAMKESVRKAVSRLAPDVAINGLYTANEALTNDLNFFNFLGRLVLQISAFGLLLAAVGIYGVVANLAAERTREIGIRAALGATPGSLVWLFLRNGVQLAALGAGIGLVAALLLLRVLGRMLPMVPGISPLVAVTVSILLLLVTLVACWLPSRRALKVDPIEALKAD
ncbi:MAG TPA: ABC transporter permease [Candidatus Didemnitutus sp.]|nr:ABC transporter permease [Candidatus Didemnitutus sp.]